MRSTVLVLGATGRTGRRVVEQLLERGAEVRVVARSADRLPEVARHAAGLAVTQAGLLSLSEERVRDLVQGCDAVVCCLGHNITFKGIWGRPHALVTRTIERVCRAAQALRPPTPVKLALMSSVAVNRPGGSDTRRGWAEKAVLALLRSLVPPAKDNQRAADFLRERVGMSDQYVEWVAVRPDTLLEGEVTEYAVHDGLVDSLMRPGSTNRANVAHFMCELIDDPEVWRKWKHQMPVVVNTSAAG